MSSKHSKPSSSAVARDGQGAKITKIELNIDTSRFLRKMPFTAYRLCKHDAGILMEFFYHDATRGILDSYACFIGNHDAQVVMDTLKDYIRNLPETQLLPNFAPDHSYRPQSIEVCSMLQMARTGNQAEILLVNFSLHAAINSRKSGDKVGAEISCRLLSGFDVHRAFVLEFMNLVGFGGL